MSECKLPLLSDKEVQESITNIETWINIHGRTLNICAEDLAVAVPGECLFTELMAENEEAHREIEKGVLVYTDAREEQYLWLRGDWQPLDKILKITSLKDGWVQTNTLGERLLVLILTQLDYRARESEGEVPYGCCPPSDPTYMLWVNHRIAGMASIKRKGTSIWGGEEVYRCDTLDTLYVRPCYRRHGHTLDLLTSLTASLPPGEHLGLSHPVSLSMCKVLLKFVRVRPELRDTLWTLDEDGEVSGTVMIMLGSVMMREALYSPPAPSSTLSPLSPTSPITTQTSQLYLHHKHSALLANNNNTILQSGVQTPVTSHPSASTQATTFTSSRGAANSTTSAARPEEDKDEPCDTS